MWKKPLPLADLLQAISSESSSKVHGLVISGVSTDSRQVKPRELFVALKGERFDGHDHLEAAAKAGAAAALVHRWVKASALPQILVADTQVALLALSGMYRQCLRAKVICVTGANGKTTTKDLLAHVLRKKLRVSASQKSFNNFVGVPLTLLGADIDDDVVVVEAGTNHLGEAETLARLIQPNLSVVTSLAASHLEGLGTLEGVASEETAQLAWRQPGGLAIVNGDHPLLLQAARTSLPPVVTFGVAKDVDWKVEVTQESLNGVSFSITEKKNSTHEHRFHLSCAGAHNARNATAVWILAKQLGFSESEVAEAFSTFQPPAGRNTRVELKNNITLLHDAYNANPGSMAAALRTLEAVADKRRKIFICGDMLELGSFAEQAHADLGKDLARSSIDMLIAVGEWAETVTRIYQKNGGKAPTKCYRDSGTCAKEITTWLQSGDLVFLKGSNGVKLDLISQEMNRLFST